MSTKIHTGFRLTARTMREALDSLGKVSIRCQGRLEERQATCVAELATRQIDKRAMSGLAGYPETAAGESSSSPISQAWDMLADRQAEVRRTCKRDPVVDYEVIFRIWLCRPTNEFVGYVAAENASEVLQVLFDSRAATEYGYWNNTDHPEHLNERQWEKRGKVWGALIAGKSGPCFEVRVPEPRVTWGLPESVLGAAPTYDSRVERYTQDLALNLWCADMQDVTAQTALAAYFDFRELQRDGSPEVAVLLAKARGLVLERLAPVITKEMLLGR